MVDRRELAALLATSAGLLAWGNLVVPRLPGRALIRTGVGAGAALALTVGARSCGVSAQELGLGRPAARAGLLVGAGALVAGATAYRIAWAVPAARRALARAAPGRPRGPLWAEVLLHIPVGTVLTEELAFRGVLDALARRTLPGAGATAWPVGAFALWHVHPALRGRRPRQGPAAAVAGTLAVTVLGGLAFTGLRRGTGSLLAPAGLHLASNALGLVATVCARRAALQAAGHPAQIAREGLRAGALPRNGLPSGNAYP